MAEFRKDPVIGRWVIVAEERVDRPSQFVSPKDQTVGRDRCPFCPGREGETPPELLAFRDDWKPNGPGWWVRVVENKYPALSPKVELDRQGKGMYDYISGFGHHEVVIETPDHDADISTLPHRQVEELIWAYRDRYIELTRDNRVRFVLIFKNYGRTAGASIEHPHSQVIAMPAVPKRLAEELEGAEQYYNIKDRCVFCDMVREEAQNGAARLVNENNAFICFVPFAARFPYEICILPKTHQSHFADITKEQVMGLGRLLKESLNQLASALDHPPYNLMFHTAPPTIGRVEYYHWHIEILPRLTTPAGFEWGSGFYINPVSPEESARQLREIRFCVLTNNSKEKPSREV